MKLKTRLEDKAISALKLAKASGKITGGLNATRRKFESSKLKFLFVVPLAGISEKSTKFKLPEKDSFSKEEVSGILNKFKIFMKNRKKKKETINIKKEMTILQVAVQEKNITIIEGLNESRLGKAVGLESHTTCVGIVNFGRSKNIFDGIIKENKE